MKESIQTKDVTIYSSEESLRRKEIEIHSLDERVQKLLADSERLQKSQLITTNLLEATQAASERQSIEFAERETSVISQLEKGVHGIQMKQHDSLLLFSDRLVTMTRKLDFTVNRLAAVNGTQLLFGNLLTLAEVVKHAREAGQFDRRKQEEMYVGGRNLLFILQSCLLQRQLEVMQNDRDALLSNWAQESKNYGDRVAAAQTQGIQSRDMRVHCIQLSTSSENWKRNWKICKRKSKLLTPNWKMRFVDVSSEMSEIVLAQQEDFSGKFDARTEYCTGSPAETNGARYPSH